MATLEAMTLTLLQKSTGFKLQKRYTTIQNGATVSKYTAKKNGDEIVIKIYDYGLEAGNSRYFVEAVSTKFFRRFDSVYKYRTLSEALNSVYWEGLD